MQVEVWDVQETFLSSVRWRPSSSSCLFCGYCWSFHDRFSDAASHLLQVAPISLCFFGTDRLHMTYFTEFVECYWWLTWPYVKARRRLVWTQCWSILFLVLALQPHWILDVLLIGFARVDWQAVIHEHVSFVVFADIGFFLTAKGIRRLRFYGGMFSICMCLPILDMKQKEDHKR